jgi:hypothetical protein
MDNSNLQMQEDSNALKNALFGYCMQKLYGFKILLVDILKLHNEQMFIVSFFIVIKIYYLRKKY